MLEKAELHVHLDGAVEPETLREIDPSLSLEEITRATTYTDFSGFIQAFIWVNRKLTTPEHYARVARRLFQRLEHEGVVYCEVILSVGVILWKQLPFEPIFAALAEEAANAKVQVRWIFDAVRQFGVEPARPVFDLAARYKNEGVVAIGLGGDEAAGPAAGFACLFAQSRDHGLRLTCHAGESVGPRSVWQALSIGAERIGHGIRSIEDPSLVEHLARHQIPLEVCVTSNLRTGVVKRIEEHPIRRLFDAGVPIVINSDDPAMFDCTLESEYQLIEKTFGFSKEQMAGLAEASLRHAFAFDPAK